MSLVPVAVSRLLRRGAVIAETVCLDHEPKLRPVEVHPKSAHPLPCPRWRQVGTPDEPEEAALEL
jgi:hypothetical protein